MQVQVQSGASSAAYAGDAKTVTTTNAQAFFRVCFMFSSTGLLRFTHRTHFLVRMLMVGYMRGGGDDPQERGGLVLNNDDCQ